MVLTMFFSTLARSSVSDWNILSLVLRRSGPNSRRRALPLGVRPNLGLGYLIQYGSQIFKMNIVMTAVTILAVVSSLVYLVISWIESAVMRRR